MKAESFPVISQIYVPQYHKLKYSYKHQFRRPTFSYSCMVKCHITSRQYGFYFQSNVPMAVSNEKKQFASLANYDMSLDEDDSKVCASGSLKTSERYPQYSVWFSVKLSIKEVIKIQFNFGRKSKERHCYLMVGAGFQNSPKQQWPAF